MKTTAKHENTVDFLMDAMVTTTGKEDFLLAFWIHWVENVTIRTRDFQNVLASASVNRWFLFELAKEEKEFQILAARYVEISGKDKDRLYCDCINKMMSKYPKALLDQAQKREEKPNFLKVNGIRIETPIINLN